MEPGESIAVTVHVHMVTTVMYLRVSCPGDFRSEHGANIKGQSMESITLCQLQDPWVSFPQVLNVGHGLHGDPRQYVRRGSWTRINHYCVLQLTLSGQGIVEDANGLHVVAPGHAFLLRMPERQICWRGDLESGMGWEFIWISFAGGGSEAIVDELVARIGRVQALDPSLAAVVRWRSYVKSGGVCVERAVTMAHLVWDLLGEYASRPSSSPSRQYGAKIAQQALGQIGRLDVVPQDVRALAASLHVSREHLCRMMVNHLGKTPQEVLSEERLRRAQVMLRTTQLPNRAIAEAIGLSVWQLVRLLRDATGLTPAEYRQSIKAPANNDQGWGKLPSASPGI